MCRQAQKNPAQKRGFLLADGTVGEHIQFGKAPFTGWEQVTECLLGKA
jgi:hypothetical protein